MDAPTRKTLPSRAWQTLGVLNLLHPRSEGPTSGLTLTTPAGSHSHACKSFAVEVVHAITIGHTVSLYVEFIKWLKSLSKIQTVDRRTLDWNKKDGYHQQATVNSVSAISQSTLFGYLTRVPVCRCLQPICGGRHLAIVKRV